MDSGDRIAVTAPFRHCPQCGLIVARPPAGLEFVCTGCGFRYFHNVACGVAAFITHGDDLLVTRRAHAPAENTLDLPGGFVGPDETLEQALARELAEELALHVLPATPCYLFSAPNRYLFADVEYATADLFFHLACAERPQVIAGDDVAAAQWQALATLVIADFGLASVRTAVRRFQLAAGSNTPQSG